MELSTVKQLKMLAWMGKYKPPTIKQLNRWKKAIEFVNANNSKIAPTLFFNKSIYHLFTNKGFSAFRLDKGANDLMA